MKQNPVRTVLDTNILVSGIMSQMGPPGLILKAVYAKKVALVTSTPQIIELNRVLNYPRIREYPAVTDEAVIAINSLLVHKSEVVNPENQISVSKDPADNRILEIAVTGKVKALVTGDKSHLLSLKTIESIPIITAREFLETFLKSSNTRDK